jgi:hypothetical protein
MKIGATIMSDCTPCIRHLQPTQISILSEAAPALLTVIDGELWLTGGDGVDIVLAAGECIENEVSATPLASALGGAATIAIAARQRNELALAA